MSAATTTIGIDVDGGDGGNGGSGDVDSGVGQWR
jgi:hypothetical protein